MFVRNSVYKFCKVYFILAILLSLDLVSLIKFSLDFVLTRYLRIKQVFFCILKQKKSACFSN